MGEHRFWTYKPLRENIDQLSPTMQNLLGFADADLHGVQLKAKSKDWDRSQENYHYLARTGDQVLSDPDVTDQEIGNRWFDEGFYTSGFWRPATPNASKDSDYITRLRHRRPW